MIAIPGADFPFTVSGTEIEGGDRAGVDVQYPWETRPARNHSHVVTIPPFHIDRTGVTNAQYQQFLDATHYRPGDSHNFLAAWDWSDPRHPHHRGLGRQTRHLGVAGGCARLRELGRQAAAQRLGNGNTRPRAWTDENTRGATRSTPAGCRPPRPRETDYRPPRT